MQEEVDEQGYRTVRSVKMLLEEEIDRRIASKLVCLCVP